MDNNDYELRQLLIDLGHADNRYFKSVPVSFGYIRPGDFVTFEYDLSEAGESGIYTRLCLVVRNDTGSVGYLSLKNNWLVSCFRLNSAPAILIKYIIERLYKNRTLCSRRNIVEGLTALLGSISYRTYMLRRIQNFQKFNPDKNKIKQLELGLDSSLDDLPEEY